MKRFSIPFAALAVLFAALGASASASAAVQWDLSTSAPDRIAPGAVSTYVITVRNTGDTASDGGGSLDIDLPAGITGLAFTRDPVEFGPDQPPADWSCEDPSGAGSVHCELQAAIAPGAEAEPHGLFLEVAADPLAAPGPRAASFTVSGGGAPALATATEDTLLSLVPNYGVAGFDASVTDPAAAAYTSAAGHPYAASTTINLNTTNDPLDGAFWPDEPPKDIIVDVPPGLIGNPSVVKQCSLDQLVGRQEHDFHSECPSASQVGVTKVVAAHVGLPKDTLVTPLNNMVAPPDVPARLAFIAAGVVVVLDAELRSGGDYGLTVASRNTSEGLPVIGSSVTLWGSPADPAHTPERACPGEPPPSANAPTCEAGIPVQAFLRLPTSCQGPLTTTAHTASWFAPGAYRPDGAPELSDTDWKQASFLSHLPPGLADDPYPANFYAPDFPGLPPDQWGAPQGVTDCAQVPFDPEIALKPTTTQADSPTGLEVDLSVPQDELTDPLAIAQSDLRDARVTLPAGMTVNPASADGLGACSSAQIDLHGQNTEPSCPDSSKIGTVTVETPLLEEPLAGSVYLAKQGDNPFNSLLALYIVVEARGQIVKLAGRVQADPQSGRLTTTFADQPQLPFSHLHLALKSGPRAPLITPPTCGTHTATATLTPWSGNAPVPLQSSFQISSGPGAGACPANPNGLDPRLDAGLTNPIAGATGDFSLKLSRGDAQQRLASLDLTTPPGLAAYLKGVPYCPDTVLDANALASRLGAGELASPSCPPASQIGVLSTGAGAGPTPFYVSQGRAYLAGPYRGAPLSLAAIVPAVAGPFDLGTVLVRTPLDVDPTDAHLTAHTVLPTILQGIPLDVRVVNLLIDRPHFILGPTDCSPMQIAASVRGEQGATANPSSPLQVANCAELGFKPRLSLRLKGGTQRTDHPRLIATLKAREGQANIARTQVTLPRSAFLDQGHIRTVCTRVQFAADACPKGSIYGRASATTPLLDQPLSGPVYLRSSSHELPDLVVALQGPPSQPIEIDLAGRTDSVGGALRNTFEAVPDAPVSRFRLELFGGKRGLVVNSRDLCAHRYRATVQMDGQNGRVHDTTPAVKPSGCGKARKHHRRRAAR